MDEHLSAQAPAASAAAVEPQQLLPTVPPASIGAEAAQLARLLYNHNPFYVISALLVLSGAWRSASHDAEMVEAGAIAVGLGAYTLLLAVTAWGIIRLGHVWEDVRSILLVIVLLFLAISVSSDPVLTAEHQPGASFAWGGFVFAVLVSEVLLRSLPLRLPARYRVPYYLVLALFFLYPLAISPLLKHPPGPSLYWALWGFSAAAGLVSLTLLPAVRGGAEYIRRCQGPWAWPAYPWVLFGMFGLCVCLRAYYLCVSFHPVLGTDAIFGWYFLIPFLLAVNVLLIEAACVSRSNSTARGAVLMPILLIVLSMAGHRTDAVYRNFLEHFLDTLHGTPLYLTLCAAIALYAYAALRGVRGAGNAGSLALAALAVVTPVSFDLDDLMYYRSWPLVVAGLLQVVAGLWQRQSLTTMLGVACALAPVVFDVRFSAWGVYREVLIEHVAIAWLLVCGAVCDDRIGRRLRMAGAVSLVAMSLAAAGVDPRLFPRLPPIVVYLYPLVPIGVAVLYAKVAGGKLFYGAAVASLLGWPAVFGYAGYRQLREQIIGLNQILWGLAFFLLAMLVSLLKTGWWPRRRDAASVRQVSV